MQTGDEQARLARQLLAGAFHGVLSTHSLEKTGYPFGSVVPYALEADGFPLLLLSHLSQHTRNLDADGRCGLTLIELGSGDVQTRSRLSALGDVLPYAGPGGIERYFAYFPHTRTYHEQLGFRFYVFRPARFHWNGGFATARWFAAERIVQANPLSRGEEEQLIRQFNQAHAEGLIHFPRPPGAPPIDAAVTMVGVDAEGLDLRHADRLYRVPLPQPVGSAEQAQDVLTRMLADQQPGHD